MSGTQHVPNTSPTPAAPQLPEELTRWRTTIYGDSRDDIRAALSAGTDIADDLIALEYSLITAISEPADPAPDEHRQGALRAITRLLHDRATLLHATFAYLWDHPQTP